MFAPAHSSSSSCSHPPLLTLTSSSLTTLSRPTSPSTLPISKPCVPISRNEDYGPMAKTPPLTGYEPNVAVTLLTILRLLLRSSRARMSRQSTTLATTMLVSRCWDWRRAHQKCACFATVYTGERSWSQSEAHLSLQWTRFVSRCTVNFSKHEATRRLIDTKTQVLPRVSWRSDQDHFGLTKKKNCSQEQNQKSWEMSEERILPKITLVYWIDKLSPKYWKLGRLSQDMNSPDENKIHFTNTGRWRTSTSWFSY